MIVIGTAGHIDHGKSAIVRRLTGTDPDRLPEEKNRGMTIDLGFAFYTTPSDDEIAFVDVPGHERFVKNMIAGAGGTDAVMLVIAADDGWMPQSQEHFQIVKLLGVQQGFIVINKIDLVEPDWLELLEQEIRDQVAKSFLADAPIFRVSAQTGEGFDSLVAYLNELPAKLAARKDIGKARLYIDRSFIRPGIGGVVTGTLRGGRLSVGQPVGIWPSRTTGKIRSLQTHNDEVSEVTPGHRTAASFSGVDKEKLVRGGVISDRTDLSYFADNPVLALEVRLIPESPISLSDRRKVLLIVGTTEMEGEIRLYDRKELKPAEEGIVFFRPEEPVYTLVGDHFIIRLITPMETLGGGRVLDHLPRLPRRKNYDRYSYLTDRKSDDLENLVKSELRKQTLVRTDDLLVNANYSRDEITAIVGQKIKHKEIGRFGEYVFHREYLDEAVTLLRMAIETHLKDRPHLKGLTLDNIVALSPFDRATSRVLVNYLLDQRGLVQQGELYNLAGREMSLKGVIKQAHDEIMRQLRENPFSPPDLPRLAAGGKNYQQAIKYIIDTGEAYKCGSSFLFLSDIWEQIIAFIRDKIKRDGQLAVADLREKFGLTRKWVIPILEETDRLKLTERQGDIRVRGEHFEK